MGPERRSRARLNDLIASAWAQRPVDRPTAREVVAELGPGLGLGQVVAEATAIRCDLTLTFTLTPGGGGGYGHPARFPEPAPAVTAVPEHCM